MVGPPLLLLTIVSSYASALCLAHSRYAIDRCAVKYRLAEEFILGQSFS